jgi:hypothetical protein
MSLNPPESESYRSVIDQYGRQEEIASLESANNIILYPTNERDKQRNKFSELGSWDVGRFIVDLARNNSRIAN